MSIFNLIKKPLLPHRQLPFHTSTRQQKLLSSHLLSFRSPKSPHCFVPVMSDFFKMCSHSLSIPSAKILSLCSHENVHFTWFLQVSWLFTVSMLFSIKGLFCSCLLSQSLILLQTALHSSSKLKHTTNVYMATLSENVANFKLQKNKHSLKCHLLSRKTPTCPKIFSRCNLCLRDPKIFVMLVFNVCHTVYITFEDDHNKHGQSTPWEPEAQASDCFVSTPTCCQWGRISLIWSSQAHSCSFFFVWKKHQLKGAKASFFRQKMTWKPELRPSVTFKDYFEL